MEFLLEYITIGIYLLFLIGMGYAFSRFNRNPDDYIRGGAQGTWWLVGASALMGGISAFTFTGNASAIYTAGFSPLIIYVANTLAFLLSAAFFAPWFRQTRAYTGSDILRQRFGPEVEQFSAYAAVILGNVAAAIWLWGLATFSAAVFGLPVEGVILGIGLITLIYSTTGGRWAVMATDFVQSLILLPITILIAVLCVIKLGGFSGIIEAFSQPDIAQAYRLVKDEGEFPGDQFSMGWILGIFILQFFNQLNLGMAHRFFSVKDGNEARKAALLAGVLMAIGTVFWFIPPTAARILFSEEVAGVALNNPSEASYAIAAQNLLPNGLMGLMVVAMFAATMSSMDSGLNGAAGVLVRNVIPPFVRLFGGRELTGRSGLIAGQICTLILGTSIIGIAYYFSQQDGIGLFDSFLILGSVIGMPMTVPLIYALFIRSLPRWSYFFIVGFGLIPVIYSLVAEHFLEHATWSVQKRVLWVSIFGTIGTGLSMLAYRMNFLTSTAFKAQVEEFYTRMHTPVDYAKEIGEDRDHSQLKIIGMFSALAGCFIMVLLLLPNPWEGRLMIALVGLFVLVTGLLLRAAGRRKTPVQKTHTEP